MLETLGSALVGLAAGLLSSALGIGGALVTTPVVRLVFERPELVAVGTPLAIVVPTALAGAITHTRQGTANARAGLLMGTIGAPAAVVGALLASVVGGGVILVAKAAILAYLAIRIWGAPADSLRPEPVETKTGSAFALMGGFAGFCSGLLGLGGGFIMVPLLVALLGFTMVRAAGTSLIAVTIMAIPGALTHALLGHVDWTLAATLALGVVPGAYIGARLAGRVRGVWLRRVFAATLVTSAGLLAYHEVAVFAGA